MPGVDVMIAPSSLTPVLLEARSGWAPSTGLVCWHVDARHIDGDLESVVVSLAAPADCIPAPEPGLEVMLAAGLVWLVWIARRRGLRFSRSNEVQNLKPTTRHHP